MLSWTDVSVKHICSASVNYYWLQMYLLYRLLQETENVKMSCIENTSDQPRFDCAHFYDVLEQLIHKKYCYMFYLFTTSVLSHTILCRALLQRCLLDCNRMWTIWYKYSLHANWSFENNVNGTTLLLWNVVSFWGFS